MCVCVRARREAYIDHPLFPLIPCTVPRAPLLPPDPAAHSLLNFFGRLSSPSFLLLGKQFLPLRCLLFLPPFRSLLRPLLQSTSAAGVNWPPAARRTRPRTRAHAPTRTGSPKPVPFTTRRRGTSACSSTRGRASAHWCTREAHAFATRPAPLQAQAPLRLPAPASRPQARAREPHRAGRHHGHQATGFRSGRLAASPFRPTARTTNPHREPCSSSARRITPPTPRPLCAISIIRWPSRLIALRLPQVAMVAAISPWPPLGGLWRAQSLRRPAGASGCCSWPLWRLSS